LLGRDHHRLSTSGVTARQGRSPVGDRPRDRRPRDQAKTTDDETTKRRSIIYPRTTADSRYFVIHSWVRRCTVSLEHACRSSRSTSPTYSFRAKGRTRSSSACPVASPRRPAICRSRVAVAVAVVVLNVTTGDWTASSSRGLPGDGDGIAL